MEYIYTNLLKLKKFSFWERLSINIEYYKYVFFFSIFKFIKSINGIFKTEPILNAEEVFEYKH